MSSYTDNPLQFSPYISQMPLIQERSIVGREKQAKYEEGVQRIQSSIDNVAGLDVVRDVDKQYLQSKLDELGNNLKTVAAGDFSNFQLVNSVGGMVKSIANDKTLLEKISDTAKYKRDTERVQADVKEGKDNPANTYAFTKGVNDWMNGDINTPYQGRYLAPRDVWKKIKDIAGEVGLTSEETEMLFQTDTKGNPLTEQIKDKNGKVIGEKPIFNDIMVTKMTKGKDPNVVYNAFKTALTPDDFQQLAIDGEYRYANLSTQELKQDIITQSQSQISDMDSKITMVKLALDAKKGDPKADLNEISKLEKLEQIYKQNKLSYEKTRDRNLEDVDTNPDRVRGSLYTNTYLHTMAEALSPHDVSIKRSISPIFEINHKLDVFAEQKRATAFNEQMKRRQDAREQGKYEMDVIAFNERDKDKDKLSAGIDDPLEGITNDKIAAVNEDAAIAAVDAKNAVAERIALLQMRSEFGNLSDEELRKKLDQQSVNSPGDNYEQKKQNYINTKVAEKVASWEKNKPTLAEEDLYKKYQQTMREAVASAGYVESVDKEAYKRAKERGISIQTEEEVKSKIKPFSVKVSNPNSVTGWDIIPLSKEDIIEYAKNDEKSKEHLIRKYGMEGYNKRWEALHVPDYNPYNPIQRDIPQLLEVKQLLKDNNYKKIQEIKGEIYKERGLVSIPQSYTLENKGIASGAVANIVTKYGENTIKGYDQEKALKAIKDASEFNLTSGVDSDNKPFYKLKIVYDGNIYPVSIDEKEFRSTGLVPEKSSKLSPVERILAIPDKMMTGENSFEGAFFKENIDFPRFKSENYNIAANFIKDELDPNVVILRTYIKDKKTNREFYVDLGKLPRLIDDGKGTLKRNLELQNITESITEATIKQAINR